MQSLVTCADKAAIGLSILCTLHCLILPILLVLTPAMTGLFAFSDEAFHLWLLFAVLPISTFAVTAGYMHHRKFRVSAISILGMALLIIAAVFGHDWLGETGEVVFTVIGSLLVAIGHFQNLKFRHRAKAA